MIVAHLGSGASMCALANGRSIESTMGFTALDGLPMGTRPGQLDPGVVLYLLTEKGMSAAAVQDLFYREAGLKGLSGVSNDVRELEKVLIRKRPSRSNTSLSRRAPFRHARRRLGGLMPSCSRPASAKTCNDTRLHRRTVGWLAWRSKTTRRNAAHISKKTVHVMFTCVPTNEELMIARHTLELIGGQRGRPHERAAE